MAQRKDRNVTNSVTDETTLHATTRITNDDRGSITTTQSAYTTKRESIKDTHILEENIFRTTTNSANTISPNFHNSHNTASRNYHPITDGQMNTKKISTNNATTHETTIKNDIDSTEYTAEYNHIAGQSNIPINDTIKYNTLPSARNVQV